MRKTFEETVKTTINHFILKGTMSILLKDIIIHLITVENKQSLNYPHIKREWLKNFFTVANQLGLGQYYGESERFIVDKNYAEIIRVRNNVK